MQDANRRSLAFVTAYGEELTSKEATPRSGCQRQHRVDAWARALAQLAPSGVAQRRERAPVLEMIGAGAFGCKQQKTDRLLPVERIETTDDQARNSPKRGPAGQLAMRNGKPADTGRRALGCSVFQNRAIDVPGQFRGLG